MTEATTSTEEQKTGGPAPLSAADMPASFAISLREYTRGGTDRFLQSGRADLPGQGLAGFDPEYRNIIDYIVRITHRIWDEKNIGYIYDCYSHDSRVYDDFGLQFGRDKIVADTIHTVNAFPDIRLIADEIIWAGNERAGFRTSHRCMIVGHNTGFSRFGPPTSKRVSVWCIANCIARENEIFYEHVLYNHGSLLRQLGLDLFATARHMVETGGARNLLEGSGREARRQSGQAKPPLMAMPGRDRGFDVDRFERALIQNIWNRRMLGALEEHYAESVVFNGPTDRRSTGVAAYQAFVLSLLGMFPDLSLAIDEIYWMGNPEEGYLVSTRWHAHGTHRGFGTYGPPSNRCVSLWGITQHSLIDGKVSEEWLLFNELDVLMQILGAPPMPP